MSTDSLLRRLDYAQPVIARRDEYYRGEQPLKFLIDRVDPSVMRFNVNIARVAVQAVAERIRLSGVEARVGGRDVSDEAWKLVQDSDLPMTLQSAITDMLAVGSAYLIVWADGRGTPVITAESAEQVIVERHPVTRSVVGAVKRWEELDPNGTVLAEHVITYGPKRIAHLKRDDAHGKLTFVEGWDNPLGVVPVVPLINIERIHDDVGSSVIDDLAPLLDALNKLYSDMLTTSEAVARPKRWATGVNLEDAHLDDAEWSADNPAPVVDATPDVVAPFKDSDDMWVSELEQAKFGQLPGADLTGYESAIDSVRSMIMAVASLPAHYVGITTANPASSEALRAAEVGLAQTAESRIRIINRPLEWGVRMLVAIDEGVSPDNVQVRLKWEDTNTRSIAQETDAAVKAHAEGLITTNEARDIVGVSQTIEEQS